MACEFIIPSGQPDELEAFSDEKYTVAPKNEAASEEETANEIKGLFAPLMLYGCR